jgi:exodeoxyribonuclease VIII
MADLKSALAENQNKLFLADVKETVYRKHSAVANSDLKVLIDQSPKHYLRNKARTDNKETPAKKLGKLVHCTLLEPEKLEGSFVVGPEVNKRTKKGREEWAEFENETNLKGQIIIDQEQKDISDRIIDSVQNKKHLQALIKNGVFETSLFWPYRDIVLKSRLDKYIPESNTIVDLKTTKCAEFNNFSKDIVKYKYHVQAAFYSDLVQFHTGKVPTFLIVAVETFAPWEVAVYKMNRDFLMCGRAEYSAALEKLMECIKTNKWPGYPSQVQTMKAPEYLWKRYLQKTMDPSASTKLEMVGERSGDRPEPPPF